ncbi:MAG: hypothetical protein JSR66_03160 [Proteobacteria bacterium]|nr:hypothetical protein [Pseudomonadota bacterium]
MLIIQIALGIVLGVVMLRLLPFIIGLGVLAAVFIGVIALGCFAWVALTDHREAATTIGYTIVGVAMIGVAIHYSKH